MSLLSLHHVSIAQANQMLCKDLSLELHPGDFLGILGPNGCGKTTLLNAIARQHNLLSGDIRLNQRSIYALSAKNMAQEIGLLLQETRVHFPQTVAHYCLDARFPHQGIFPNTKQLKANQALLSEILQKLQLTHKAQHSMQTLSGGERRRAAIAALLMQNPRIYLLDEPVNHLDLAHQVLIMNDFKKLSQQGAIVIATLHEPNLAARYCNKILLMFTDGSTQQGWQQDLMTAANLSNLYQHPIDAIRQGEQTYWLPTSNL